MGRHRSRKVGSVVVEMMVNWTGVEVVVREVDQNWICGK